MSSWIGVLSSKIIGFEIECFHKAIILRTTENNPTENMLEKICLCNMFSLGNFLYVLEEETELVVMNNLSNVKGYHHAYQIL